MHNQWPPHWPRGKVFALTHNTQDQTTLPVANRLTGLVIKVSVLRAEDPGFKSCLHRDFFRVESYQWLENWHSMGYPARRGVIGSSLGLVGLVSVYCDWVRRKVWSATSISVWQHVQLSEQIHPSDTLPCCSDVKQQKRKKNPVAESYQWLKNCYSCGCPESWALIRPVLGLVGLVLAYCEWVRQ